MSIFNALAAGIKGFDTIAVLVTGVAKDSGGKV
jgi:hypothetical protein